REWRRREIWTRRWKSAKASIPITVQVRVFRFAVSSFYRNRHQIAAAISFRIHFADSGSTMQRLMDITDEMNDQAQCLRPGILISTRLEYVYILLQGRDDIGCGQGR